LSMIRELKKMMDLLDFGLVVVEIGNGEGCWRLGLGGLFGFIYYACINGFGGIDYVNINGIFLILYPKINSNYKNI
jgi:hypothetical protein